MIGGDLVSGEKLVFLDDVDFFVVSDGYGLDERYFEVGLSEDAVEGFEKALPGRGMAGDDLLLFIIS